MVSGSPEIIINACTDLLQCQNYDTLSNLKNALNKFFDDSECQQVIYTENGDNMFFGIYIKPYIESNMITQAIYSESKSDVNLRISSYRVEIDSKLLDGTNLYSSELAALIINEVHNVIASSDVLRNVAICALAWESKNEEIKSYENEGLFKAIKYGIIDAIRKLNSIFELSAEFVIGNEFMQNILMNKVLEYAYEKVYNRHNSILVGYERKLTVLDWALHTVNNYEDGLKSYIRRTLESCKLVTGSVYEKDLIDDIIEELDRKPTFATNFVTEGSKGSLLSQIKYEGLKSLDNDLYEYSIRVKNVDTQDESLYLLRQINNRIGILDDYLRTENLDERDIDRWSKLLGKYTVLRDELAKKSVYTKKMYGLFTDYNALQDYNYGR